jgi:TP901 family phage tail tape measure protein
MFGSGNLGMGVTFSLVNQATQPAAQAGQSITSLQNVVNNAANSIQQASNKITSGIVATVTSVMLLLGPFTAMVGASTEFNFQLSRAGAISQATAQEVSTLKQAAFDLGATSMYNATEIAKTEVVLAQAGFFVSQQLEMLPGLTDLATAGVVSLDYAAGVASDTLFQFGLGARDMGRVSDVIVNAANMSNMSVENFGNAMKYFGPTAKAFEMSLEEASAYIEMMANSGMRGSIGTRAFGTALMNLASPTKQAAELMGSIGFEAYDSAGKFVGLESMIRRLQVSMQGMTNKQRDNALSVIFGNESTQEMLQLLNLEFRAIENGQEVIYRGADALHYFTQKNLEAKGVAEQVSKGIRDNLKSDIIGLSSAFETLKIKMGDVLEGPLRGIVKEMRSWVIGIQGLMDTSFGKWLVSIAAGVSVAAAAMIVLGFVITILIPSIWAMVTAVGALMIEFAPVIAIVGAIVGLFVLAKKSVDEFSEVMSGQTKATGFIGLMQRIGGVLMSVYEIWTTWNGSTFTLSQGLHDALERIGILDFVLNLATWIVRIKEFFLGVVEGAVFMYVVLEEVFGYVKDSFNSLFDTMADLGLAKLTGDLSLFRMAGMAASYVAWALTRPFVILGTVIGAVVNMVEFLLANLKELGKLVDWQSWLQGAAIGASTGDWSALPGANFKNTFADKGKILPGVDDATGNFSLDAMLNRQSEIMSNLGLKSDGRATESSPMGPSQNETFNIQLFMDTDLVAEKVLTKQALDGSRK